ncbi:hypothetical protein BDA96_09G117400 [Sorghum bicolor]|uniref:Uncharacterized protein n=2 Tax=Sorghum bicolor TaxID=4558 RepID=A0A921U4G6_SORBI|nr:hypothetical protein BDA96_09G117400 [Sorghum bicolor]OQU77849.1 hypothetical protein SORBI_3009G111901 [Sorghum bicolor]
MCHWRSPSQPSFDRTATQLIGASCDCDALPSPSLELAALHLPLKTSLIRIDLPMPFIVLASASWPPFSGVTEKAWHSPDAQPAEMSRPLAKPWPALLALPATSTSTVLTLPAALWWHPPYGTPAVLFPWQIWARVGP